MSHLLLHFLVIHIVELFDMLLGLVYYGSYFELDHRTHRPDLSSFCRLAFVKCVGSSGLSLSIHILSISSCRPCTSHPRLFRLSRFAPSPLIFHLLGRLRISCSIFILSRSSDWSTFKVKCTTCPHKWVGQRSIKVNSCPHLILWAIRIVFEVSKCTKLPLFSCHKLSL